MSDAPIVLFRPRRRGNGYLVAARYAMGDDAITIDIFVPDALVEKAKQFVRVAGAEVGFDQEVGAFWDSALAIAKGITSNPLAKMAASVIPGGATILDGASLAFGAADAMRPKKKPTAAKKPDIGAALQAKYGAQLAAHEKELRELRRALDELRKGLPATNLRLAQGAREYEKRRLAVMAHKKAQRDIDDRAALEAMAQQDETIAGVMSALDALSDPGIYVNGDDDIVGGDDDPNVAQERLRRMLAGDDVS